VTGEACGMEPSSAGAPPRRVGWLGPAACAWALLFAAMHYYWAFGGAWPAGETEVEQSARLLVREPWYYWRGWTTPRTVFVVAGSFPLVLARPRGSALPLWLRVALDWGTCAVLFFLLVSPVFSDVRSWTRVAFPLCAAGLAMVGIRYGTVPRWALLAATGTLGLCMVIYGAIGIGHVSPWGLWWLLGGVLFLATVWRHGLRRRITAAA
jgi:hypothetical protein